MTNDRPDRRNRLAVCLLLSRELEPPGKTPDPLRVREIDHSP